jgi:hypothetical protein
MGTGAEGPQRGGNGHGIWYALATFLTAVAAVITALNGCGPS